MIRKWASSFVVAAALAPALASAERYNLQISQTVVAREVYDLHTLIFVICCVIFVVVFGAMIYAIIKHRQAAGHKDTRFHENVKVEIAWAVIPFLILIGMVYPATKAVISMNDTLQPRHDDQGEPLSPRQSVLSKPDFHEGMSMILSLPV
jgi:cytochrome c oxidase subunit 2